jgi:phospholipid/cholesterol/gamma-HCH transport system substrate-binding protein
MKRVLAIIAALIAVGAVVVLASGAGGGGSGGGYRVRAIFMNAFSVIPGEDVKIAGVKVGKIDAVQVTPDNRAAVVLRIDKPGFDDFRRDAECSIRPQSLIGEKYVECTLTQPRPDGAQPAPRLAKIQQGDGKGQYLLPVSQTSKPVDLDLVNNVLRLPYRQRLAIIINELGTGLAGRGDDLRMAVRNADPALKETDKVLAILAGQNRTLAALARNSDAIMAPLARDRGKVADFVVKANTTAQATAQRSSALEQSIAKLPAFLRQLTPTMVRLGALSDQMTPVLSDLGAVAPDVNRLIRQVGPFSQAGIPALTSLGDASVVGREALVKSKPIIQDLRSFGTTAKPLTKNLAALLTSLRDTGGIERALDYVFYQVAAINGYDSIGHYLRAGLIVNLCSTYAIVKTPDCTAHFEQSADATASSSAARSASATSGRSPALVRTDAVLRGQDPAKAGKSAKQRSGKPATKTPSRSGGSSQAKPLSLPSALLPGSGGGSTAPAPAQQAPAQPAPAQTTPAPSGSGSGSSPDPAQSLLDYLLGGS